MSVKTENQYQQGAQLSPEDLAYFKKLLNDTQDELLGQVECAVAEMTRGESREIEIIDSAMVNINQSLNLRINSRKSLLIKKIREALKRIEEGTYGYCDICMEPISFKRLAARPVTSKCRDCKEEEERLEEVASRNRDIGSKEKRKP